MSEENEERVDLDELGTRLTKIADEVFENTAKMVKRLRNKSTWAAEMGEKFFALGELMQEVSSTLQTVAVEVAHIGADALQSDRMPGAEFDEDEESEEIDLDEYEEDDEDED